MIELVLLLRSSENLWASRCEVRDRSVVPRSTLSSVAGSSSDHAAAEEELGDEDQNQIVGVV